MKVHSTIILSLITLTTLGTGCKVASATAVPTAAVVADTGSGATATPTATPDPGGTPANIPLDRIVLGACTTMSMAMADVGSVQQGIGMAQDHFYFFETFYSDGSCTAGQESAYYGGKFANYTSADEKVVDATNFSYIGGNSPDSVYLLPISQKFADFAKSNVCKNDYTPSLDASESITNGTNCQIGGAFYYIDGSFYTAAIGSTPRFGGSGSGGNDPTTWSEGQFANATVLDPNSQEAAAAVAATVNYPYWP